MDFAETLPVKEEEEERLGEKERWGRVRLDSEIGTVKKHEVIAIDGTPLLRRSISTVLTPPLSRATIEGLVAGVKVCYGVEGEMSSGGEETKLNFNFHEEEEHLGQVRLYLFFPFTCPKAACCYSLGVHVLRYFRFYCGAHGRVCSFSCTNATIKKFRNVLAKHSPDRCSLGPTKGLEEEELVALAANKELNFSYTPKAVPVEEEASVPSSSKPAAVGSLKPIKDDDSKNSEEQSQRERQCGRD